MRTGLSVGATSANAGAVCARACAGGSGVVAHRGAPVPSRGRRCDRIGRGGTLVWRVRDGFRRCRGLLCAARGVLRRPRRHSSGCRATAGRSARRQRRPEPREDGSRLEFVEQPRPRPARLRSVADHQGRRAQDHRDRREQQREPRRSSAGSRREPARRCLARQDGRCHGRAPGGRGDLLERVRTLERPHRVRGAGGSAGGHRVRCGERHCRTREEEGREHPVPGGGAARLSPAAFHCLPPMLETTISGASHTSGTYRATNGPVRATFGYELSRIAASILSVTKRLEVASSRGRIVGRHSGHSIGVRTDREVGRRAGPRTSPLWRQRAGPRPMSRPARAVLGRPPTRTGGRRGRCAGRPL